MLKRRNTIHPGQHTKPTHPLDRLHSPLTPTSSSSTNPFLSSSLDNLSTLITKNGHYHQQPLSANFNNINPFLYESISYNPFASQNTAPIDHQEQHDYRFASRDQYNDQQHQQPQTNTNNTKDLHRRRMSLDVFKVPFNLNKSCRATCAASDLKRMLTIKTSSVLVRRQQKKADDRSDSSNNGANNHDSTADEILKTSRYHPDEQVVDHQGDDDGQQYQDFARSGDRDSYRNQHQPAHYQYSNDAVEEFFNPFVQPHNNHRGHVQDMAVHPFDSAPDRDSDPHHQPFQATDRPSNIDEKNATNLTHRRYSVFSDWSIEDCPRLLAMQQRQQQQQREEQERLDRLTQVRMNVCHLFLTSSTHWRVFYSVFPDSHCFPFRELGNAFLADNDNVGSLQDRYEFRPHL